MNIEIKSRWDSTKVLWSGEAASLREAVLKAIAARANLADANLADADLARANLADANLAGANLAGANLAGANLAGANLAGAYLAGANLAGADLADADLADADLADADLARANLAGANLAGAYLAGAYLARAKGIHPRGVAVNVPPRDEAEARKEFEQRRRRTAAERAADYRASHPDVPVVENLDQKILDALESGAFALDMGSWHGKSACGTTHCRAGSAIHLAGEAGYALERKLADPARAGRAIYRASTGRSPHFFASNEHALADIKRCAAEDGPKAPPAPEAAT